MKRIFDIIVSALLLIAVLPVGLVAACLVGVESKGPVFYRSRRIGLRGVPFDMLKFRSMYVDGESRLSEEQRDELARDHKLSHDPRITRIGKWLRASSIDELPQLFNVLRGDMSLVGPRPKLPQEIHLYGKSLHQLLSVKPGVTGYWQIFRKSAASDEIMRKMDLFYIERRNAFMDLAILLRTPWVVIAGRNM